MNLKTAASRLSVHYQTAYKLVRSGSLAAVKIGGTYEVSEAAIDRYRAERESLRGAAEAVRETASTGAHDRDAALEEVRAVAEATTTTAQPAFDTIAWEAANAVGDTCVVRVRDAAGFHAGASYNPDPTRRAALAAVVDGFVDDGPNGFVARVCASKQPVLVPHVPQDRLRATLRPEHRQFLDCIGMHSLIAVPVVVDGTVEAIVSLGRATPGAPYTKTDLDFAVMLTEPLALAIAREHAYCAGWVRRRELVTALRQHLHDMRGGRDTRSADTLLANDGFAEVIDHLDGRLHTNPAAHRLTNGDASVLMNGFSRSTNANGDRLHAGDLEYHDDERDVVVPGIGTRSFFVHRGIVRDDAARPLALVVVAQPAPTLS